MDEVEANLVEGAIGWLVQIILAALRADKLDAWIRQVGLADDTEKLRSEIERVEVVATDVKGRAVGNRPLARSLGRLRELLYDADDMVDELDYYRLQQQVQGEEVTTSTWQEDTDGGAEQVDRSSGDIASASNRAGKPRASVWNDFHRIPDEKGNIVKARCNYCQTELKCPSKTGTSTLHNHLNSKACKVKRAATEQQPNVPSAGEGASAPNGNSAATGNTNSRKRMRTADGVSTEVTEHMGANTHAWCKAEISNKIQQMTHQLQEAASEVLRLRGLNNFASSKLHQNTTSDLCLRTSSLLQRKIYGRVEEKNSIIKLMTEAKSDGVTVLPIVGIGGIGKTALAQFVYNDPIVESSFQQRIWVWVSNNFDEVRITREMLDFVCQENHEKLCSFAKLQEILMNDMKSKRFLLVLDDVWDDKTNLRLNKLLAPFNSNNAKGNVIIMTTRIWSVAKRIGTVGPVELGALNEEDSWLLLKACAFGDEKHEPSGVISTIGKILINKLEGNPLAIEAAGELLSEHHTVDHWNNILKNEDWKSLQLSGGIMPSLKRSYDQLTYHLQQCFLYCSIFPSGYEFRGEDLVRIWISQGFVTCRHSNKRLEEIGEVYLKLLVNSGFFYQQVERKESSPKNRTCYFMCGLIHYFARLISRTDCATIDGPECSEILPTVRHLSILTDSAFCKDQDGKIIRNKRFEEKLQRLATSASKLRTLALIGQYDCFFFKSLKNVFQKVQNLRLRLLHITSTYGDFGNFFSRLVNCTHLRYLRLENNGSHVTLPQALSKCYHLQVLDIGSCETRKPKDINNLVSLRHLVAKKRVCSSIANIGKMTSLQELGNFIVQKNSSGFEVTQLKSMNKLVQLGVSRLENVRTQEEACGAKLKDKQHLERLILSWRDANDKHSPDIASEVLEGLEPHHSLKYLGISGYNGATSPTWLLSSLTCLQTLHLEKCGKWQKLPLKGLSLLIKLVLIKMRSATEVSIPSLEQLVLIGLRRLKTCSCTSVRDLNSSLKVLKIKKCPALEVFPLFENCQKFEIERTSWLCHLRELTIYKCPLLCVHNPLPPSSIVSKLLIGKVSTLPMVEGSSTGTLTIGVDPDDSCGFADQYSDQLETLDDEVLSFRNLRFLTGLTIRGCRNLATISLKSLRQLVCLKSLELYNCPKLLSSNVPSELTCECMSGANHSALPSLERLHINDCGITGEWLSLMLQHAQGLQELSLIFCEQITGLSIGEEENSQPNLMSATEAPSLGYWKSLSGQDYELCPRLERLMIDDDSVLTTSLCKHLTSLQRLELNCGGSEVARLTVEQERALQLLTSLQELRFEDYYNLIDLPTGLHSLPSLKRLEIFNCEGFARLSEMSLPPSLEELDISNCSEKLVQQCRTLASSTLKVKINGTCAN